MNLIGVVFIIAFIVFMKCFDGIVKDVYEKTGNKNVLRGAAALYIIGAAVATFNLLRLV